MNNLSSTVTLLRLASAKLKSLPLRDLKDEKEFKALEDLVCTCSQIDAILYGKQHTTSTKEV